MRFVAFVNEEPPFFYRRQMGSMVYAEAAHERGDDIRLMKSFWRQGYPALMVTDIAFYRSKNDLLDCEAMLYSQAHAPRQIFPFPAEPRGPG